MKTQNELSRLGKILAGILLIAFIGASITLIIGYWPDRLPAPNSSQRFYNFERFHVELLDSCEVECRPGSCGCDSAKVHIMKKPDSTLVRKADPLKAQAKPTGKDSGSHKELNDNTTKTVYHKKQFKTSSCYIHLNILIMILVALGGFLGNMLHIATSFTTFVGSEKLKKSWMLWYFVKPFTASGLALAFYFVFRAGFLNYSAEANLNLYGIMTIALLSGLFTDIATQKLKEIFEVTFRPKETRPDGLNATAQSSITGVLPARLNDSGPTEISISGSDFTSQGISIRINNQVIESTTVLPNLIKFTFTPSVENKAPYKLYVLNKEGKELYTKTFAL